MRTVLCFVLCLFVCVGTGSALKCYSKCTKDSIPDEVECPSPLPQFNTYSVCIYKLTYDLKLKEKQIYAGCGQLNNGELPSRESAMECKMDVKDPNRRNIEIVECKVCDTDLCNEMKTL